MEKDIKREALRRYLKYFKVWFIIAGILAVITIGVAVVHLLTPKTVRGNSQDPTERVFDYADMLTDEEEQSLREYIAECEEKIQADIVIVTISESVEYDLQNPGLAEAFHAKEVGSTDWSTAMRDLADNFGESRSTVGIHQMQRRRKAVLSVLDYPLHAFDCPFGQPENHENNHNRKHHNRA